MYILTGGAGFIGSVVLHELNARGITDIIIVDALRCGDKWKNLRGKTYSDVIYKDDFLPLLEAGKFSNIEAVIHLGACSATTETNADYLLENNYRYTRRLALWSIANNARFVYASSAATYGNGDNGFDDNPELVKSLSPLNMYGYSKHMFDTWAMKEGLLDKIAGVKYFNVFGPNEYHKGNMVSLVFKAYHQVLVQGKISLFKSHRPDYDHGCQLRDFIYVKDAVNMTLALVNNRYANGLFNLGTGQARSWNDLANAVFAAMNKPANIEYIDMPTELQGRYQYYTCATHKRLLDAVGPYTFTSLEDAVADYIQNYLTKAEPYL